MSSQNPSPSFSRELNLSRAQKSILNRFQLKTPIKQFSAEIRPICLPTKAMWEEKFVGKFVNIYGYGRTEAIPVPGKDQTSCRLLTGIIQIVNPTDGVCLKVEKTF